ncbi:MAG: hypothetical protein RL249_371, partial [Actinomycetota bacterium]
MSDFDEEEEELSPAPTTLFPWAGLLTSKLSALQNVRHRN